MLDLFPKPWAELDLAAVERFFADAGEEGTTWEAKADDERGMLRPDSVRKAANGLANRIGGYVIIGATRDKKTRVWSVPGIEPPDDEPELWIGKVLRRLNPAPRFEPKVWHRDDGRIVAVVWVDPVDIPPCMTPQGQVYERVSGETLPVQDPGRLDALFRRGEHARARAEQFADRAATRALDVPGWESTRAVGVSVALASIGRDTDDIASRLFVPSLRKAIVEALWRFFAGGHGALGQFAKPDNIVTRPQQDAFAVFAEFDERHVLHPSGGAHRQPRSAWMLQATWDGAVAASAVLSPAALEAFATFDQVVMPGWREVVPLVQQLGGYGPAQLTVGIYAAPDHPSNMPHLVRADTASQPPPPPPKDSLYARLGEHTRMRRWTDVAEPTTEMLGGLQRELQRASGQESWEPEDEPPAS